MKRLSIFLALMSILALACDDQETTAIIDDGYPSITVYRAWWLVTVFADPIAPGMSSDAHRVVPGNETAYFILAPGWDSTSSDPPTNLIVAKTIDALHVDKGDALHIAVDDAHVTGNCATGHPLTQADADLITGSIFAGEFAGFSYDAATCTLSPRSDAGLGSDDISDAGTD